MKKLREFDPHIGQPETLEHGVRRIVAPNPSPMTFRGTNTYLIGTRDIAVIDPGPDNQSHLRAILEALEPAQRISHIFVTHAHLDHSPLAARLGERSGAPVLAFGDASAGQSAVMHHLAATGLIGGGEGVDASFRPDICLEDGAVVEGSDWHLQALWTPGHFGNHLCLKWDTRIFTGDLVMGWASSLVSPPDGDLTDFMRSCARLQRLEPKVLYPGHGAEIGDPAGRIAWLLEHRRSREREILARLAEGPATPSMLAREIYTETPEALLPAAQRNVLAHLIDLVGRARVQARPGLSATAEFSIVTGPL